MPVTGTFKKTHSLEDRIQQASSIRKKKSDHIPVVFEYAFGQRLSEFNKTGVLPLAKFLTWGQCMFRVRCALRVGSCDSIFMFLSDGTLAPTSETVSRIWEQHSDEDGWLYVVYAAENTFG